MKEVWQEVHVKSFLVPFAAGRGVLATRSGKLSWCETGASPRTGADFDNSGSRSREERFFRGDAVGSELRRAIRSFSGAESDLPVTVHLARVRSSSRLGSPR